MNNDLKIKLEKIKQYSEQLHEMVLDFEETSSGAQIPNDLEKDMAIVQTSLENSVELFKKIP